MFAKTTRFAMTVAFSIIATSSFAQEFSESHLSKARAAITATQATDSFDAILFDAAAQLKNRLTRDSPDKADEIAEVVDAEAIALAPRRGDLEQEAARQFAEAFTEAELEEIAAFFGTPAGTKYLKSTPGLARELGKAARIWANGINRDLTNKSLEKLDAPKN